MKTLTIILTALAALCVAAQTPTFIPDKVVVTIEQGQQKLKVSIPPSFVASINAFLAAQCQQQHPATPNEQAKAVCKYESAADLVASLVDKRDGSVVRTIAKQYKPAVTALGADRAEVAAKIKALEAKEEAAAVAALETVKVP